MKLIKITDTCKVNPDQIVYLAQDGADTLIHLTNSTVLKAHGCTIDEVESLIAKGDHIA